MKQLKEILLALILAVCNLMGCAQSESEPEVTSRDTNLIISDLIAEYSRNNGTETDHYTELLDELRTVDSNQGEIWDGIMEYWTYANEEMPILEKKLPEDLPDDDTLCIVVLGFQLNADGTMQKELIGRLQTALACARQYEKAYVLCTGGGTAANNPNATEAGKMGEWLTQRGLKKNRLIIENQSLTTAENASFSYQILKEQYPQVEQVVIVSSDYHIPWGSVLFETEFRLHESPLHIVSNCGYPAHLTGFGKSDLIRCEASGMQQLYAIYCVEQQRAEEALTG